MRDPELLEEKSLALTTTLEVESKGKKIRHDLWSPVAVLLYVWP